MVTNNIVNCVENKPNEKIIVIKMFVFVTLLVILITTFLLLIEYQRRKLSALVRHLQGPKEIPILGSEFVLKNDDIAGNVKYV